MKNKLFDKLIASFMHPFAPIVTYESFINCSNENEIEKLINQKVVYNSHYDKFINLAKTQRVEENKRPEDKRLFNSLAKDSQKLIELSIKNYLNEDNEKLLNILIKNDFFINEKEWLDIMIKLISPDSKDKKPSIKLINIVKKHNISLPQDFIFSILNLPSNHIPIILSNLPVKIHTKNEKGQNALQYLCDTSNFFYYGPNGISQKMKTLIRHGLKLTTKNENGLNCLHLALMSSNFLKNLKIIKFILDKKDFKNVYSKTEDGSDYEDMTTNTKALELLNKKRIKVEKEKIELALSTDKTINEKPLKRVKI